MFYNHIFKTHVFNNLVKSHRTEKFQKKFGKIRKKNPKNSEKFEKKNRKYWNGKIRNKFGKF